MNDNGPSERSLEPFMRLELLEDQQTFIPWQHSTCWNLAAEKLQDKDGYQIRVRQGHSKFINYNYQNTFSYVHICMFNHIQIMLYHYLHIICIYIYTQANTIKQICTFPIPVAFRISKMLNGSHEQLLHAAHLIVLTILSGNHGACTFSIQQCDLSCKGSRLRTQFSVERD